MTRPAHRRKTDARTHKERCADMTTEERHLAFMIGLAQQVTTACDEWLRARGVPPGTMAGEWIPAAAAAAPAQREAQHDGTGGTITGRDGIESPQPFGEESRQVPFHRLYGSAISHPKTFFAEPPPPNK